MEFTELKALFPSSACWGGGCFSIHGHRNQLSRALSRLYKCLRLPHSLEVVLLGGWVGSELGSCWLGGARPLHLARAGSPTLSLGSGDTSRGPHRSGMVSAERPGSPHARRRSDSRPRADTGSGMGNGARSVCLHVQNKTFETLLIIRRSSLLEAGNTTLLQVLRFSLNKDTELHCNSDDVQVMWV